MKGFINKSFNIADLNFVLVFSGFAFVTAIIDLPLISLVYRAFALIVALVVFVKCRKKPLNMPRILKFFVAIYLLLLLKCTYELVIGRYGDWAFSDKFMAYSFLYGVALIPSWAILKSRNYIHFNNVLIVIFFALIIPSALAVIGANGGESDHNGRFSMSAHQGSLAFGDNSAMLILLSITLLAYFKKLGYNKIWKYILIGGLILGVCGVAKAGSRGPFISVLAGVLFIFTSFSAIKKSYILVSILFITSAGFVNMAVLEHFAPALYSRMTNTVVKGDTSGRDKIFEDGLELMKENPVFGDCPILIDPTYLGGFHNAYLTIGVGLGIWAFLLFIMLLIIVALRTLKINKVIYEPFYMFMFSMLWFYMIRGITGVCPFTNAVYCVVIALTCYGIRDCKWHQKKMLTELSKQCNQLKRQR